VRSSPSIADVSFVRASAADVRRGLVGYVSLSIDGALRLDGIALRRTIDGDIVLSFPTRIDRRGHEHALVRPLSDEIRRAIERDVLHEIALQGIAVASWAPRQERRQIPCTLPRELRRETAEDDHDAEQAILELGAGHADQRTAGGGA
jgi:DNA-binding cell septation regulator SpoVG